MRTIIFEDKGQDFLEWDIEDGKVVACRPFQEEIWKGTRVINDVIEPGDCLCIRTPLLESIRILIYPVISVREGQS